MPFKYERTVVKGLGVDATYALVMLLIRRQNKRALKVELMAAARLAHLSKSEGNRNYHTRRA